MIEEKDQQNESWRESDLMKVMTKPHEQTQQRKAATTVCNSGGSNSSRCVDGSSTIANKLVCKTVAVASNSVSDRN